MFQCRLCGDVLKTKSGWKKHINFCSSNKSMMEELFLNKYNHMPTPKKRCISKDHGYILPQSKEYELFDTDSIMSEPHNFELRTDFIVPQIKEDIDIANPSVVVNREQSNIPHITVDDNDVSIGDTTLWDEYKSFRRRIKNNVSKDTIMEIKILSFFHKLNAPLSAYDDFMKMMRKWSLLLDNYNFSSNHSSYKSLMKKILLQTNMAGCMPKQSFIPSPIPNNSDIPVTILDFDQILLKTLSDSDLMKSENYCFPNNKDPRISPVFKGNDHVLNDIHSAKWYYEAHKNRCRKPNDVLLPIGVFIDKAVKDVRSRLSFEPVQIAPLIFKRSILNTNKPWSPIGFLHDFDNYKTPENLNLYTSNLNGKDKATTYHLALRNIFHSIKAKNI